MTCSSEVRLGSKLNIVYGNAPPQKGGGGEGGGRGEGGGGGGGRGEGEEGGGNGRFIGGQSSC